MVEAAKEIKRERIIRKVHALMALSESSNVHEAASAANAARRLIVAFDVQEFELGKNDDGSQIVEVEVGNRDWKNRFVWETRLARQIANHFFSEILVSTHCVWFVGRKHEAEACAFAFNNVREAFFRECERQTQEYVNTICDNNGLTVAEAWGIGGSYSPNKFRHAWFIGAVSGFATALYRERLGDPSTVTALVVQRHKEIEEYKENTYKGTLGKHRSKETELHNWRGYERGQEYGLNTRIQAALEDHSA